MYSALRRGVGLGFIRLTVMPMERRKLDENRIENPLIRDPNKGIDRVYTVFDRDENGTLSKELAFINVAGFAGMIIGAIYGGLAQSRISHFNYRESNEATLYYSNMAAHRSLHDEMTIGFGKGAFRWGRRIGIFCLSFAGISTLLSKYRNKVSVVDYSVAGLITGAMYKISLGPKGMISGAFFGAVLGTFAGLITIPLLFISGVSMDDIYDSAHVYFRTKDELFHGCYKTQLEEEDIILHQFYPGGKGSMTHTLDALPDINNLNELKFNKSRRFDNKTNENSEKKH